LSAAGLQPERARPYVFPVPYARGLGGRRAFSCTI
jgi:hypothetical protein